MPVADMEVVVVEGYLVRGEDPALIRPVPQRPVPGVGSYDDVGTVPGGEAGEYPADGNHVGVRAVSLDGLPVDLPDIRRPAEVVGIRVSARLAVTGGDRGAFL